MTAFGGALTDPTKIMGGRIAAYIVDVVLASILLLMVGAALHVNELHSYSTGSPYTAERICRDIRTNSEFGGIRNDQTTEIRNPVCFTVGSKLYYGSGTEAQHTRFKVMAIWATISILNLVVLQTVTGASVGKQLLGLRVVIPNGRTAGIGRNLLRWVLLIVDTACCFLPGLLTSFNTKGHRRIGDLAAGTYVVHRSAAGRPLSIPGHLTVRRHDSFGGWGPAPVEPELTLAEGGGIDRPVFDASRNTYVRYDQISGVWFQWDEATRSWIPAAP